MLPTIWNVMGVECHPQRLSCIVLRKTDVHAAGAPRRVVRWHCLDCLFRWAPRAAIHSGCYPRSFAREADRRADVYSSLSLRAVLLHNGIPHPSANLSHVVYEAAARKAHSIMSQRCTPTIPNHDRWRIAIFMDPPPCEDRHCRRCDAAYPHMPTLAWAHPPGSLAREPAGQASAIAPEYRWRDPCGAARREWVLVPYRRRAERGRRRADEPVSARCGTAARNSIRPALRPPSGRLARD
ncbi:hypothetical protein BD413DRAFT_270604 [Trametes elegans]|nr:hypothetical protein BD413DRAFT_270604 [Trametes elegans]